MKGNTVLLVIIAIMLGLSLFFNYMNSQQIRVLRQENTTLWIKIDSVHRICSKELQKRASGSPSAKSPSTGSALLDYLIQLDEKEKRKAAEEAAKQKVIVSTKYRLEDRYVSYKVQEPEFTGEQAGEVVLDIFVDYSGAVRSAKLRSVTGVTNEEVIEACKKAALQTSFNYNSDQMEEKAGTITYTFKAR